jgi:hypothetical protein
MAGVLSQADRRSFDSFEDAKSAMMTELDHHAGLENRCRVNIIEAIQAHLHNARGPEWYHSDGSCQFWINPSET